MTTSRWVAAVAAVAVLTGCSGTVVAGHPQAAGTSGRTTGGSVSFPTQRPASNGAALGDPSGVRRIESDATADLVSANDYDYRSLPASFRAGLAHTTGSFRVQYRSAFTSLVRPEAQKLRATQRVQIDELGLEQQPSADRATLLVALQTRITQKSSAPRVNPATAVVTVDLVGSHWLISALKSGAGGALGPVGNAALTRAGTSVATGVVDVTSLRRAQFAADYARALAVTTGSLKRDVASRRSSTRSLLERGRFDLRATVTGEGVLSADGSSAKFLVTLDGYKSTAPDTPVMSTLVVTASLVGSRWLLGGLQNVGVR